MNNADHIRDLLERVHKTLSWTRGGSADWPAFRSCFSTVASLYPSGRPLVALTVDMFIERLEGQRLAGDLLSYEETIVTTQVEILGNVAIAYGISEAVINGVDRVKSPNTILLARDGGKWVIAAMAWDKEQASGTPKSDLGCP